MQNSFLALQHNCSRDKIQCPQWAGWKIGAFGRTFHKFDNGGEDAVPESVVCAFKPFPNEKGKHMK